MSARSNLKIADKKKKKFSISWKSTDRRLHEPARGGFKGGPIIYGSINYDPQKDFYDFYDEEKIVDTFFNSVKDLLVSGKDYKIQGYFELKNYQQTELVEPENTRVWFTNVFVGRYFNEFIRGEIKKDILEEQ